MGTVYVFFADGFEEIEAFTSVDVMSRHRGAKPPRRCGLLGEISLLSPG